MKIKVRLSPVFIDEIPVRVIKPEQDDHYDVVEPMLSDHE